MSKVAIPKFQLQERLPMKKISVNHALVTDIFSMNNEEYQKALRGEERKFLEANTAKHGTVKSYYWLKVLDDKRVKINAPLDELDRDILDACISAQEHGFIAFTYDGIYHSITGNTNPDVKPTDAWKKEIADRVDRLACIRVTVDTSDAHKAGIYRKDSDIKFKGSLLPCEVIEAYVNGQLMNGVIHFLAESPLLRIARARSGKNKEAAQILTYATALLNVPNQRNTPITNRITNYIVRRVVVAKQHSNMTRTIRLDTLFKQCGLADADRRRKLEYRKSIEAVMKSLVDKGEIQSFEFVQESGQFTKITFNFS